MCRPIDILYHLTFVRPCNIRTTMSANNKMQQFPLIDLFVHLFEFAQFHLNLVTGRPQRRCIVELYIQSEVLLKMGEFVSRNMYSKFK